MLNQTLTRPIFKMASQHINDMLFPATPSTHLLLLLITMNPRPKRMNLRLKRMILMIIMTPRMKHKMRHQRMYHLPPIRYLTSRPSLRHFGITKLFLPLIMRVVIDEMTDRSQKSSSKSFPLNALFLNL